jgi:acyl carrier protein phosphodiesterase
MNYLAHIYLSGNNKLMMIGNFIGDAVKGRRYETLHPMVRKGVLLHRAIDDYTDRHPVNAEARKLLHPVCGKYAGVYLDMFYDHFLAAGWDNFSPSVPLRTFCIRFYFDAVFRYRHLPLKIRAIMPSLVINNRLKSYADMDKLREALDLMSTYTSLPRINKHAIQCLQDNYEVMRESFYVFFPQLIDCTADWRRDTGKENAALPLPDIFLSAFKKSQHSFVY